MNRYEKVERIGEGTYGVVFKSKDLKTGKFVAMKKVRLENEDEGIPATTVRELSLLKELKHPNIVSLLNSIIEQTRMYLIFEYLECDLKRYLDKLGNNHLDELTLKSFLYQILDALLYCHRRRILHRDLKPQNLLVQGSVVKLADFGLGRTVGIPVRAYTHEIVTLWYRAPEVLLGSLRYSCPVDIWSVGCIFAEMATKKPLFPGDSEIDQLFRIFRVLTTPNEETWPGVTSLPDFSAKFPEWTNNSFDKMLNDKMEGRVFDAQGMDLIKKMFIYNPSKRIPAVDAIKHPYFDNLNKSKMPGYNYKPKMTV